jgi:cobalamin-dependent methionine synthase I
MTLIEDFPVDIRYDEVYSVLGYAEDTVKKERFMEQYMDVLKDVQDLIEPAAVFEIVDVGEIPARDIFAGAREVAFCVTTIGPGLERWVAELVECGKMERSVVLDALGSGAAEGAADFVNKEINEAARSRNMAFTRRFSPGYCTWDITDQRLMFDLVPAERIRVRLTESLMMLPLKSVSFAVNVGLKDELDMDTGVRTCGSCDRINCKYNKTHDGHTGGHKR